MPDCDLIDRDQIPAEFGVSLDLVCRLIKEGKVQTFPATKRTMCQRHGKCHWSTVHICRLSRSQVREALEEYRARGSEGAGFTTEEVLKRLQISLRLLQRWEVACDPLGGDPLEPGDGRRNGRAVNLYPVAKVRQIECVFAFAKKGRVNIQGIVYLNTNRALKYLRKVEKRFCAYTLYNYHKDGCPPLGGARIPYKYWQLRPGKGAVQAWWPEEKIIELKRALTAQRKGCYLTEAGPRYTSRGAAGVLEVSVGTIKKWRKKGRLSPKPVPNRRGPGRRRQVDALETLESAKRIYETPFIGYYEGESRANLSIVAEQLTIHPRWARELVLRRKDDPAFGHEMRTPPHGGRKQHTILSSAIPLLRQPVEWLEGRGMGGQESLPCVQGSAGTMPGTDSDTSSKNTSECAEDCDLQDINPYAMRVSEFSEKAIQQLKEVLVISPSRRSTPPPSLANRLQIDLVSGTATLDGDTFSGINADGLRALDALRQAQLNGKTPISKQNLREKYLPTCNHNNTLTRWFRTLPEKLNALIDGQAGAGLRLIFPPV